VHWLTARLFTYHEVHVAIDRARVDYGDWPLSEAPLGVAQHAVQGDPRGTVVLEPRRGVYVDVIRAGDQLTLPPLMLDLARDVLRAAIQAGPVRRAERTRHRRTAAL
jgi:hypothetical protein